ncbi:MAG: M1 family metallopeptidase [Balneolales bacterium]
MHEPEPLLIEEEWYIPDGPVQTLRELTWDLQHQKLWVRFNFEMEQVIGRTELMLTSKQVQSELVLDAKTMEFEGIYDAITDEKLDFNQDSAIVTISPGYDFNPGDTLVVGIRFISSPPQRGLYFVNPRGDDPVKPTQIWTLGQPEDNSFWFPTIDHPAERATQETWISVPERFATLSNGVLQESRVISGDTLRTDYWRLHQPHAPYLFAIAVGEYEVTEQLRNNILFRYYTESKYTESVELIYRNTVDMLQFSEEQTGVPYPWDPVYSQAPVHDFIASGMENTTATLLYDAVQFDQHSAPDLSNQDLIMHEIIHQWFGNLVTAKNWANLPLNEGFANYYEGKYILESDGYDSMLWKMNNDRLVYFEEAQTYRRPIIFDRYQIPEDMYDRHTYQKTGQVLRMLNDYLGNDLWRDAVKLWLERFLFDAVDIYDLQQVIEEVSDEDMSWFFDQWFHMPGHPYLDIYQDIRGEEVFLRVTQLQDTTYQPVYELHPEIIVFFEEGYTIERVTIENTIEEFIFEYEEPVSDVVFDPDRVQLAEYIVDLNQETLISRINRDHLLVRSEALGLLDEFYEYEEYEQVLDIIIGLILKDPFWGVRMQALEILSCCSHRIMSANEVLDLAEMITSEHEKSYQVRISVLGLFKNMEIENVEIQNRIRAHLEFMMNDSSYFVAAEAIRVFGELFPDELATVVAPYADRDSYQDVIKKAVADALLLSGVLSDEALPVFFQLSKDHGDKAYTYNILLYLFENIDRIDENELYNLEQLFLNRLNDPYPHYRRLAYRAMGDMGAVHHIEKLHEIMQHGGLDDTELNDLRKAIRVLEIERDRVD